ncbi:cytochrome B6 [Pseudomonas sp. AFG_SD02_1510_Pfu_092]|uniref:cytochrome-c peroxidase n=1 Tax=Pseudomonas sp. AFG_SD02_1510_Pfu_092 TaxID=2259497 RepID=UPI000DF006B0|nr:cytochrome c peroxidase [Pseudomonas sp. AFG_SD02_1510_Pfu_092]RCL27551.1 cytochrome B6 [Pseudomonas sp. AFG_SD02_1510_Pfu_092]
MFEENEHCAREGCALPTRLQVRIVAATLVLLPALALAQSIGGPLTPLPPVPALDPAQVQLGRKLFNDPRLSADNRQSCADCHRLDRGGADGQARSPGGDGQPLPVNTPSVFNASLNFLQFWDGRAQSFEGLVHLASADATDKENAWVAVVQRIADDPAYRAGFAEAYGQPVDANVIKDALVTYQRTLLTPDSRFDTYLKGDTSSLSLEEKHGYQRFQEYGCIACHQGVNIGGNMLQKFGVFDDYFANRGSVVEADRGRYNVTGDPQDLYLFKVPSLRNVAVTAPYFHDGSAPTLEAAVDAMFHYQLGRTPSDDDKALIIKFLQTLTGRWEGRPL